MHRSTVFQGQLLLLALCPNLLSFLFYATQGYYYVYTCINLMSVTFISVPVISMSTTCFVSPVPSGQLVFCGHRQPLYRTSRRVAAVSQQAWIHTRDLRGACVLRHDTGRKHPLDRHASQAPRLAISRRRLRQTQRQPGVASQLLLAEGECNHRQTTGSGQEDRR